MKLIVQPEAEADILDAVTWYDSRSKVVRQNFLSALDATLEVITQQPLQYQAIYGQVRRVMVRNFPYALIYMVGEGDVNLLACFHTSRDPKRWRDRIHE